MYVDDLLTGARTVEKALLLRDELMKLMKAGGFSLRKCASNSPALVENLQNQSNDEHICLDISKSQKTLVVKWKPREDLLCYKSQELKDTAKITKRSILSQVAAFFDSLGLIGPVIITAKVLLQKLWKLKLNWDESVPLDVATSWLHFRRHLPALQDLHFRRSVVTESWTDIQLHGFCDASEQAYGACLYVRSKSPDGQVQVSLLCSKTRVAPLMKTSVPRLELYAALLLAELVDNVTTSMEMAFDQTYLWSDSKITLCWIQNPSYKLKTFVGNRVAKIQELTNPSIWRHVLSGDNPADLASRGVTPDKLATYSLWFSGPSWLAENSDSWPAQTATTINEIPEQRTTLSLKVIEEPEFLTKYSSFNRLVRVIAYCFRFIHICRSKVRNTEVLSADELNLVSERIIGIVQRKFFGIEIKLLQEKAELPRGSKLQFLNPYLDSASILRVGGRLQHADWTYDQTHPIILPEKHFVTKSIIQEAHAQQLHAGTQSTLYHVRQRYWPMWAQLGEKTCTQLRHVFSFKTSSP